MPLIDVEEWREGRDCDCCGRYGRVYAWKVYPTMVRALAELYRHGNTTHWVTVEALREAGRVTENETKSMGRLKYWGLAEQRRSVRTDGGKEGAWRCTLRGANYLRGWVSLPSTVLVFGGKPVGEEGPAQNVHDVMQGPFDLQAHLHHH